jgi:hypothetical protein
MPQILELMLGDHRLQSEVQRAYEVPSQHSGRPLLELHAVAATRSDELHRTLSRRLPEATTHRVNSAEPWENGVQSWCVSWNSYAEFDGEHRYTLILREAEELALQELLVDGVALHPYEYRESFNGDELTIRAKLVGSRKEVLRLRNLLRTRDAFPVVRRGIQDTPREMRFGVAEWSLHEGQIRYRMVLVDKGADLSAHPELVRVAAENTRSAAAFYMNFVENLAQLLEARGLLPAELIEAARTAAHEQAGQTRREFWRVPDVDLL